MHTADLCFEYRSPTAASHIEAALGVEIDEIEGDRATASLRREGDTLQIDIEADDLVALRAGLNTWQTLAEVAERAGDAGSSYRPHRRVRSSRQRDQRGTHDDDHGRGDQSPRDAFETSGEKRDR